MIQKQWCRRFGFILLCILLSSCATAQFEQLKKKIIRQKKEKVQPVRFLEEPVRRKNSEYYEEHILYFKTWNSTLITFLGENRKREVESAREARRHLASLPKYLVPEYADKLQALVTNYENLTAPLLEKSLPKMFNSSVAKELGRIEMEVRRDFSFKEVKDHLLPDPTRIDLTAYEDKDSEQLNTETGTGSDDSKKKTEASVNAQSAAGSPQAETDETSGS